MKKRTNNINIDHHESINELNQTHPNRNNNDQNKDKHKSKLMNDLKLRVSHFKR